MTSIMIDRNDGLSSATAIKGPCRAATTVNIVLAGEQVIDGVAVVAEDRVLVKNQTAPTENGIYVVDTGAWRRSADFRGNRDVRKGTQVLVTDGTVYVATSWYVSTANPISIGETAINFVQTTVAASSVGEIYVNAKVYGAGSGGDDSLIAEALFAANPGAIIYFPAGVYNLNTELNVPAVNGNGIKGAEPNTTIFNKNGTDFTGIKFDGSGVVGWSAENFRVNGVGGTQTAGYGLDMPGVVGQGRVRNLQIYDCWRGIGLGPTDFSWFDSCIVTNSYSHGIHLRNADGLPAASLQWQNTNNLSQMNNGSGMIYEGVAASGGFTQATSGKIEGYSSFANFQYGFVAIGVPAMSIRDVRLVNCFLGGDGLVGALLDTYGGKHQITGGFFELIGRGNRGRNFATAAPSNAGNGIQFTANNDIINVAGVHLDGNGYNGLISEADYVNIAGVTAINNGGKLAGGQRNGIYHAAGEMVISGMMARGINSTAQEHAITCWDGGHLTIAGSDLRGNSGTAINYGANAGSVVSSAVRLT